MTPPRRTAIIDSLAIACFVSILIGPLFRLDYLDNWQSIESTFIADARMIAEHFPHPGWQPLWYCGTRSDYVYPPALRYGTVLISRLGHLLPARAYHVYIAAFYVIGILSVYWLVRIGSRSRGAALLSTAATALLSPVFLFLPAVRHDSAFLVPQRLHVLISYGEGPHMSAVAVLPAALAAVIAALRKWRPAVLAAAAALCALVVANNFYGATSLAILYPIAVWSIWLCDRAPGVWQRAAAIPVLTWGLTAFWLTPSYIRITLLDLKWVSLPGNTPSRLILGIALALYCLFTLRTSNRRPEHQWAVFTAGAAVAYVVWVLGAYSLNLKISGDSGRLLPELDLALILVSVEALRGGWKDPALRLPLALLVVAAFYPAMRYIPHAWSPFRKAGAIENVYEYRTTEWLHNHLPGARVLAPGTVRFWFDVWFDNAQTHGGSDQSMLNQNIPNAMWQIFQGDRADVSTLWMQALGTDAVVAPSLTSPESYHEMRHPEQFRGVLQPLSDSLPETIVYSVPRLHPGIARVVDRAQILRIGSSGGIAGEARLRDYVSIVENPAQPAAAFTWRGPDAAGIEAATVAGQWILVQETWDPAWHAYENGRALPLQPENAMGFTLINVPAGVHRISLRFETPRQNRAGQVVFVMAIIAIVTLVIRR